MSNAKGNIKDQGHFANRPGVATAVWLDGRLISNKKKNTHNDSAETCEEATAFGDKYPDFIRGITPLKPGNMSDMESLEREEV